MIHRLMLSVLLALFLSACGGGGGGNGGNGEETLAVWRQFTPQWGGQLLGELTCTGRARITAVAVKTEARQVVVATADAAVFVLHDSGGGATT